MNEPILSKQACFCVYPPYDREAVKKELLTVLAAFPRKIVVLDDDPTGIQTVHDVYVYTDWTVESIQKGFESKESIFFVLTNSRGFTSEKTKAVHREIAQNILKAARATGKEFVIISRGDSTLRGHYPLETNTVREILESETDKRFDGEVLLPFFLEGGRFTVDNVHYVATGDRLVPVGQTEFAGDKTFGYKSSNLCEWIAEKHGGALKSGDIISISLEDLRAYDIPMIEKKLLAAKNFQNIIINAIDYPDVEVFVTALVGAMQKGKEFLFRSAAALTKIMGSISDREVLTREELVNTKNKNGGLILVGSHVKRTTEQLERLKKASFIEFVVFDQHLVMDDVKFAAEQRRVINLTQEHIKSGKTVAVYTRRERFDLSAEDMEAELRLAVKISDAVAGIVGGLTVRPNFIIAKGGITSSDVGTKGLKVKKALVMGQILKGIPVWLTGAESKFPNLPYVIFPGNVGDEDALYDAVMKMQPGILHR